MENHNQKIKVVFEQYSMAHYHVPFLAKLAEVVDLVVVVSEGKKIDGLKDIYDNLPFKCVRLKEGGKNELFHPEIFDVLEEHRAEIYFSISSVFDRLLSSKENYKRIKEMGIKTVWLGCDGYMIRHFFFHLLYELLNPKLTLKTIREIIAKSKIDYFMPYSIQTVRYLNICRFLPKNKMSIVHNAIETEKIEKYISDRPKDSNKIIFTGRLTFRKRVDILIKAFKKISENNKELTLDIIGEGSELNNLKSLAEKLNVIEKVRFIGGIYDDEQLAPYLYSASLFIMPGLGGLGFNSAMAAGLPIIYTHADGTEQELFDNQNGWFFDGSVNDLVAKMKEALSDQDKLKKMGIMSKELISKKFTIANMVNGYLDVIDRVKNNA